MTHNQFGFVNHDGSTLTAPELLIKVIRQGAAIRRYEKLSYQDLTEARDYQRHYSDIYLESECVKSSVKTWK